MPVKFIWKAQAISNSGLRKIRCNQAVELNIKAITELPLKLFVGRTTWLIVDVTMFLLVAIFIAGLILVRHLSDPRRKLYLCKQKLVRCKMMY